jgi:hypothetical protein
MEISNARFERIKGESAATPQKRIADSGVCALISVVKLYSRIPFDKPHVLALFAVLTYIIYILIIVFCLRE